MSWHPRILKLLPTNILYPNELNLKVKNCGRNATFSDLGITGYAFCDFLEKEFQLTS